MLPAAAGVGASRPVAPVRRGRGPLRGEPEEDDGEVRQDAADQAAAAHAGKEGGRPDTALRRRPTGVAALHPEGGRFEIAQGAGERGRWWRS